MADLKSMSAELQRQFEDLASQFMASDNGQRLIGWYDQRGPRDRLALRMLGAFAAIVIVYLMFIAPMLAYGERAQHRLQDERALLEWLRAHQGEAGGGAGAGAHDQPIATLVNTTAQENKLTIHRYEPDGETGVKVWLEGAAFNAVVKWVYQLEGTYGIHAAEFNLERDAEPGKVSVRLSLRG